jgi:two-component system, LytTR family, response regulator
MRVAIIDDEPLAREGLRLMLAAHPDLQLAGEAGNGRDGLDLVRRARPELLLVDVHMPEMSGLEMAAALPQELAIAVVFVTAFDEYAVRAFDLHALDYLVKPVSEERLAIAVERARSRHRLHSMTQLAEQIRAAQSDLHPTPPPAAAAPPPAVARQQLAIRDGQRVVFVSVDEIDWIEAASYYVEIHTGGRTYLHRETMQHLEATLDPDRFVRIHRSRLINRERISELQRRGRGAVVVLSDGTSHLVARSYWPKLRQLAR